MQLWRKTMEKRPKDLLRKLNDFSRELKRIGYQGDVTKDGDAWIITIRKE